MKLAEQLLSKLGVKKKVQEDKESDFADYLEDLLNTYDAEEDDIVRDTVPLRDSDYLTRDTGFVVKTSKGRFIVTVQEA